MASFWWSSRWNLRILSSRWLGCVLIFHTMRITPIRRPVVSKPSPSPHLATIASGATTVSVRAAAVADAIQSWTHRIPLNVSASCEGFSQELRACEASLASSRTSFSRSARRLTAARCSLYDKRLEEIDAVFKLLSALARTLTAHLSRCASSVQCDGLMSWIGPLLSINPFYVHSCMIHIGNDSLPLDTITRCRHGDRILLTVSPQHSSRFWSYTRENTLQITCVDDEGCPFPQVLPADVQAHFSPPIASICVNAIAEPGTLALKYSVPSAVTGPLTINVEMFGVNVHSSVVQVRSRYCPLMSILLTMS